jgi:malate dehydrogenase (oxaloacetate-decarboxylating)(NADP+)
VRDAVDLMDRRGADFEYEGEMPPDVALDPNLWANYPFQRLREPANVLIMPAIHSAAISTKLMQALGEVVVVGPILVGLSQSVQVCSLGDSPSHIITMATLAAFGAESTFRK